MVQELTFVAKIISGRRITVDSDVADTLNVREGDIVSVSIRKIKQELVLNDQSVEGVTN